jgi:hypothetical protein
LFLKVLMTLEGSGVAAIRAGLGYPGKAAATRRLDGVMAKFCCIDARLWAQPIAGFS